jgi:lysophospholipid acyltransferase (LPLAT)-like uncharacterized protein
MLPLPFTRVACAFGGTVRVPRQTDRGELERLRVQLEREIDRQQEQAQSMLSVAAGGRSSEWGA